MGPVHWGGGGGGSREDTRIFDRFCESRIHARMLNFYSYKLFVPRACARDHSPRRSSALNRFTP